MDVPWTLDTLGSKEDILRYFENIEKDLKYFNNNTEYYEACREIVEEFNKTGLPLANGVPSRPEGPERFDVEKYNKDVDWSALANGIDELINKGNE